MFLSSLINMKKLIPLFLLLSLSLCWSPSFLFIKLALNSFYPVTIVWVRFAAASLILLLVFKGQGVELKKYFIYWKEFLLIGFFANAFPILLITFSQQHLSTSLAAIFNSTTPLTTILLAPFFLKNEPITPLKLMGVLLGIMGVVIIFSPSLLSGALHFNGLAAMGILLAAASYGIGMIFSKKIYIKHGSEVIKVMPAFQLLAASLLTLPLLLFFSEGVYKELYLSSVLSLLGLTIFGTAIAFILYHALIRMAGATFLSFCTLLFPVFAIFLGFIFLGEEISLLSLIGSLFIFSGLITANFLSPKKGPIKQAQEINRENT